MILNDILIRDDIVKSIYDNLDVLLKTIPEIKHMIGFEHNHPHHHLDVFKHTLLALSLSENNFDIRLALLLHDIGKPFSYQDKEIRHFKNHPLVSANIAKNILIRLGYDNDYIDYICFLIRNHDMPISNKLIEENINIAIMLYKIQKCDALAHNPKYLDKRIKYLDSVKQKILSKGYSEV